MQSLPAALPWHTQNTNSGGRADGYGGVNPADYRWGDPKELLSHNGVCPPTKLCYDHLSNLIVRVLALSDPGNGKMR